jgi:hypothetical protein
MDEKSSLAFIIQGRDKEVVLYSCTRSFTAPGQLLTLLKRDIYTKNVYAAEVIGASIRPKR